MGWCGQFPPLGFKTLVFMGRVLHLALYLTGGNFQPPSHNSDMACVALTVCVFDSAAAHLGEPKLTAAVAS